MRFVSSLVVAFAVTLAGAASAEEKFVTIGTGGQTGVYYVVGQSICKLVNRGRRSTASSARHRRRVARWPTSTPSSAGEQDMGVAQSDWQYHAYNGTGKFADQGPNKELRAVFSVHPEPFTVIARSDSGIKTFDDLKGKRVNIGNPGSGQRGTMEVLMGSQGLDHG